MLRYQRIPKLVDKINLITVEGKMKDKYFFLQTKEKMFRIKLLNQILSINP